MPRKAYFGLPENPMQCERLPETRPLLEQPVSEFSASEDRELTAKVILGVVVMGVIMMAVQGFVLVSKITASRSHMMGDVVFLSLGLFLVGVAYRRRLINWLFSPLSVIAVAYVYFRWQPMLWLHTLVTTVVAGHFAYQFGRHYAHVCTASPTRRSKANALRAGWEQYLVPLAFFPVTVMLPMIFPGLWFFWLLILVGGAFLLSIVSLLSDPWGVCCGFCGAMVSFCSYNRNDRSWPGVLESPAGVWRARMARMVAAVFLTALLVMRIVLVGAGGGDDQLPAADTISQRLQTRDNTNVTQVSASTVHQLDVAAFAAPTGSNGGDRTGQMTDASSTAIPMWPFALGLAIELLSPSIICFSLCFISTAPFIAEAYRNKKAAQSADLQWNSRVEDIQTSPDLIENQSVYVGLSTCDKSPVLVASGVFKNHAHISGDSGGGKTAMALCPYIEQLLTLEPCSLVILDLKADTLELFEAARTAAKRAEGRFKTSIPVKHFTTNVELPTYAFNPLAQDWYREKLTLYQKVDILCAALGLSYGADYGEGYYGSANAMVLYVTIQKFPTVTTLRELAERVGYVISNAKRSELHPETSKAGVHVKMVLDRLAANEAINVTNDGKFPKSVHDNAIDCASIFQKPEVHYFHLSSARGPGSSAELARLKTYSLLTAASTVERKVPVFLVIDEFQRIVAQNLEYIMQTARSMGVGVILANQSMEDLRTRTANLMPAVESNCRFRQSLAVSSTEDQKRLSENSGEIIDNLISVSRTGTKDGVRVSHSTQQTIVPRLTANMIKLASDHPLQSIVQITRGMGYTQYGGAPFIVESSFHISAAEYQRRQNATWPQATSATIIPGTRIESANEPSKMGPVITTETITRDQSKKKKPKSQSGRSPFQSYFDDKQQAKKRKKP